MAAGFIKDLLRTVHPADKFRRTFEKPGFVQGMALAVQDLDGNPLQEMVSADIRRDSTDFVTDIDAMFRDGIRKRRIEKITNQCSTSARN